MTRIALFGASGRMGRAIAQIADARDDLLIDDADPDVFIDFTAPDPLALHLEEAVHARKPIVVGTTGLEDHHHKLIDAAARSVAVLQAANTSLGIALLVHLTREAAARLGSDWDVEILEMHHRLKVDAPSGTALLLGEAAAQGRDLDLRSIWAPIRNGITGPRKEGHIGFASLRGGSVAGDHHVIFAGESERLELVHRAESRAIFAQGAVRAAEWLIGKAPGRYRMTDVLGLG